MNLKVTVIGAGPGGYVAAIRAAQQGGDVTLVEQDRVGGTCLHWGCIPSKVMKTTAELLEKVKRSREFGIALSGSAEPDMKALMARKKRVIDYQVKGITDLLQHNKIRLVRGRGIIKAMNQAEVKADSGEIVPLTWDRLILALGSKARELPAFPFDGKWILSSNDALTMEEVPRSLLILGGGVIGCEFAFIFSSLGSQVTLVEAMPRLLPLPSVDQDCSVLIEREMKKHKIPFELNTTVRHIDGGGGGVRVALEDAGGLRDKRREPLALEVEKVLVCIGREACTEGAGLENIGVSVDAQGWIDTNERMETGTPYVYAIGDALGPAKVMLAHVAAKEGTVAADNAMGGRAAMDYRAVPGVIFTMPEVGNVGLTEAQAREAGLPIRAVKVLFRNLGKPHVMGEIAGEVKIVSHAENGRVLGIHVVGPHASDLIAEGTLAVKLGCTVQELAETIHAHPTLSEVIGEAALKAIDRPIHG
jgi:dihydrolipoamide dehydrogenase